MNRLIIDSSSVAVNVPPEFNFSVIKGVEIICSLVSMPNLIVRHERRVCLSKRQSRERDIAIGHSQCGEIVDNPICMSRRIARR